MRRPYGARPGVTSGERPRTGASDARSSALRAGAGPVAARVAHDLPRARDRPHTHLDRLLVLAPQVDDGGEPAVAAADLDALAVHPHARRLQPLVAEALEVDGEAPARAAA